ncbi:hypothetical protein [Streptomyces diastatochromogenes]|uniref:hypothetical protein n=1 Tax=Streptomyces diastatochromogenes TaxID=42236 RepID=UPI003678504B
MTSSSCPGPDDLSAIPAAPPVPGAIGIATPSADPGTGPAAPPPEQIPEPARDDDPYGDPLHGLVRAAVADRPLEDVVRLITLLERRPEHARTTAEALRAAGIDRPVEDVTRLVSLLTRPPRTSGGADEAIRAAAECRPLEEVTRLMELLRHTPVEPHCVRAAVDAVAVGRPVEELAELIARLASEESAHETAPPEPTLLEPADTLLASVVPAPEAAAPSLQQSDSPSPDSGSPKAPLRLARTAAVLVFLCGAAHAPRYWSDLSQPALRTTLVASGLCLLLALALPARTVPARMAAATVTLLVTATLAAVQVLDGGRFGLPDPAWLQSALLAPPWLAGTAAAAAALAALAVLLATVGMASARRAEGVEPERLGCRDGLE